MAKTHNNITQSATVSTTAQDLSDFGYSAAQIAGGLRLTITATEAVRYRQDGTAPTATIGHHFDADETYELDGDFSQIEFIREGGTDAVVTLTLDTFEEVA